MINAVCDSNTIKMKRNMYGRGQDLKRKMRVLDKGQR